MHTRLLRVALRALGPALLVVVFLKIKDPAALGRVLASASLVPLGAVLALNFASVEFKVLRWLALLGTRGIRYPLRRARAAYYASMYVGMLTPGRIGDALRAQYLRADVDAPYAEGLATIVMDRVCDLYVLAVFVAFGVVRYGAALGGELGRVLWWSLALVVAGPLVLLVPGVAERFASLAFRAFAFDQSASFEQFLAAMRANAGRSLLITVPLTFLAFLVNYLQGYLLARALHLDMPFADAVCLLAIASLLGLLPVSISGLGVREALFVQIFPFLGHSAEAGLGFGLLVFAAMYLALVACGFVAYQLSPPPAVAPARKSP